MSQARRFGIRARLLATFLPLVAAGFIVVWAIATTSARSSLATLTDANLGLAAKNLADDLSRTLDDAWTDAVTSGRLDLAAEALESGDPKNFVWYADQLVRSKGRYAAIIVHDDRGAVVAANKQGLTGQPLPHALTGASLAGASWAADVVRHHGEGAAVNEARELALLADVPGADLGSLAFSRPVLDLVDEPIGAVTLFLSRGTLADRLAVYAAHDGDTVRATAVVVDNNGQVVLAPRGTPSDWSFRDLANDDAAQVTWASPDGARYRVAAASIGGAFAERGWRLLVMTAAAVVDAPVRGITLRLTVAFALILAVLSVGFAVTGTRIVAPLTRLTHSASRASRASQFVPISVEHNDEVGDLARSFNGMMETIVGHERDLESKVAARTRELADAKREVTDILDNMAQAIFTVSAGGRINRQFSARCRVVFGRDDLAGADVIDLLNVNAATQELASRTRFWFSNIFAADPLQWTLAVDEPLREARLDIAGATKVLTLEYAPIYVDNRVDRVMVIATDVTELRDLAAQVRQMDEQNRLNMERVAEIIALDAGLFRTFVEETDHLMNEGRAAFDELATNAGSSDALNALFRAVHTFKSNARIFKLATIQNAAHELEETLARLRDRGGGLTAAEHSEIGVGLERLQALRSEFETLAAKIFGPLRADTTTASSTSLMVAEAKIVALRKACKELMRELHSETNLARLGDAVGAAVTDLTRVPMSELLERFRKMVFDLAKELGRDVEDLVVEGGDVTVDVKLMQLLRDVLAHALRNAVDHGIEAPENRERHGKSPKGRVTVRSTLDKEWLRVIVSDDGRGVDLTRVRSRAFAMGLIDESRLDTAKEDELTELLFMPGFSTAERVTAISGRGVGMDVIRSSMRKLRGDATITSTAGVGTALELRLPADYYSHL